jgi:adenylate cyclase
MGRGWATDGGDGERSTRAEGAVRPVHRPLSLATVVRELRLWAGLVLFGYLLTHLTNHALGLVSLAAMEAGRGWFLALWRSPLGTPLLYGALLVHPALALWALYQRRHLRIPAWETCRLVLGLLIPFLLASHVVGTRLAHEWAGVTDSYTRVVLIQWELRPEVGLRQLGLVTAAWLHGCMGLHFWLRFRPWYPHAAWLLYAGALLVPVLALLGFAQAGRQVSALAGEPGWVEGTLRATGTVGPGERAALDRAADLIWRGFAASLGLLLVARIGRHVHRRRQGTVRITYADGREMAVPVGFSVLEASRYGGIPHASVCGGRGRCSTCRVRIVRGRDRLPAPAPEERRVLERVAAPPDVRLACQLRPRHDLTVVPLLPPGVRAADVLARPEPAAFASGEEREIAVLFADIRGFTRIVEQKLPYDVVFVLNRYFETVGEAIHRSGGIVNQFVGDGVMALFGVTAAPADACRAALAAADALVRGVAELSRLLAEELPAPIRIGVGIHVGVVVVGRMGLGEAAYLTAVGDTVNVAARLEQLTKELDCVLVISEPVALGAGVDVSMCPRHDLTVRNRREPLTVRVVHDPRTLTAQLG